MKNLKKLTALAGICAVTVASLAACGQSGTTTETKADTNAAQTEAGSQAAEALPWQEVLLWRNWQTPLQKLLWRNIRM